MSDEAAGQLGEATVYDSTGDKVGTISSVLTGPDGSSAWALVRTGWFGLREHVVPLDGARIEGGDVHLQVTKDRVKDAPDVDAEGTIDEQSEQRLRAHFGLAAATGAPGARASGDLPHSSDPAPDATAQYGSSATADDLSEPWTSGEPRDSTETGPGDGAASDTTHDDLPAAPSTGEEYTSAEPGSDAEPHAGGGAEPPGGVPGAHTAGSADADAGVETSDYASDRPAGQPWAYSGGDEPPSETQTADHQWQVPAAQGGPDLPPLDAGTGQDRADPHSGQASGEQGPGEQGPGEQGASGQHAAEEQSGFVGMGAAPGADAAAYESEDGTQMSDEERDRLNRAREAL